MKQIKLMWFTLAIMGGILFCSTNASAVSYALTDFNYDVGAGRVYGTSQTYLDYSLDPYYNAGVDGYLVKYTDDSLTSTVTLSSGSNNSGNNAIVLTVANVQRGETYAVFSDHFLQTTVYYSGYPYDPYGLSRNFSGEGGSPYYGFQYSQPVYYMQSVWFYLGRTGVIVSLPNITQIAPDAGIPGVTLAVQIAGKFIGEHRNVPPVVSVSGNGVTAQFSNFTPNGVEVFLQIAEDADIGNHTLSLTSDGVPSNGVNFRVGDRSPQITNITPPQGNTGDQVTVTITGTGFGLNPEVTIDGLGVSRNILSASSTEIQAVFSVADSTYAGNRNVNVVSRGISGNGFAQAPGNSNTSNTVGFEVLAYAIEIQDIPVVEKNGERTINVKLIGTGATQYTLTLRRISGTTGEAQFDNNTNQMTLNTEGINPVKIKGITESSQANNMTLEINRSNSPTILFHKEFTVATISALVFEKFAADYTDIDANPGNGQPNTNIGRRIFPDKQTATDGTDRALVRIKATVSPMLPNARVYFGSYDLDDPSANGAPLDANASDGKDNNGAVNGSKSGDFNVPSGFNCIASSAGAAPEFISETDCAIASDGMATAAFKTTMQPGDNFAIAAALTETSRGAIKVNSGDGTKLSDALNKNIPVSGEANTDNAPAIRTEMLTVWRRLHLEVDSMGNVGSDNKVTGTVVTNGGKYPAVNINIELTPLVPSTPLELNRFENGRILIGNRSYNVIQNGKGPNNEDIVQIRNRATVTIANGTAFTLYDDDDYNNDDFGIVDGDDGEPIVRLPAIFSHLSDGLSIPGDNSLGSAYILPEYQWAAGRGYNQTGLPFVLNVAASNIAQTINANRNSGGDERNDFWIGYFLIAYQGDETEDADGYRFDTGSGTFVPEGANTGITSGFGYVPCDCYQTGSCIGTSCAAVIPKGGFGSLIYQEVMQDVTRSYLRDANLTVLNQATTVPHELGHQFGLKGDNFDPVTGNNPPRSVATYKVMDYPRIPAEPEDYEYHPEHINLMRRRVSSPGQ